MGKKTPSQPPPPDPVAVANAQSASNIASATAQQKLNEVNTTGPTGTVNYVADPNAPGGYNQVTTLSQPEQQTYDLSKQAQNGALATANTQLGRVNTALGQTIDPGGVQQSYDPGGTIAQSFNQGGPLQYSFNPGQAVQGQIGPQDLAAASQQAQNAAYTQAQSRLDPQFAQSQNALETQLANQGLSQNSDAYQTAMQNYGRTKNDAYQTAENNAVTQGNAAAQQLFDQSATQGQFANSAAAQQYAQNQGQAQFNNTTANQDYSQNLGAAQFGNQAQAQQNQQNQSAATFGNQANAQQFSQNAYAQNLPINQFSGLLGLGQVGTPTGVGYTPSQVAPTDVVGANALATQAAQANASRAAQSQSGLMGGLFSLGSAALIGSDRRLKRNARHVRTRRDGVKVWRFRYRAGGPMQIGVMAQELRKVRPDLVVRRADGFLSVNYNGLGAL